MEHRVFVSSTFVDLKDHREAVQQAVRQLGAIDVSMEHFGARDERPKKECVRLITEQASSFVGIYAHRYGYIPPRSRKSITEMEFDAACTAKLPRFVYLLDDDAPWKPAFIDDGDAKQRLTLFKDRLREALIVKAFSNKDQLATYVAADIGRHIAAIQLKRVESATPASVENLSKQQIKSIKEWSRHRNGIYSTNRGLFLVHTLSPSRDPKQLFDIFIYLRKHKSAEIPEVAYAEFFLGRFWGNRVLKVRNNGGLVGISTSAYGEFLCVCRVELKDHTEVMLERYIDFGTYIPPEPKNSGSILLDA